VNDLTRVIRQAVHAGLKYDPGRRHPKIIDPRTGRWISISSTPRCPHAHKNVLRDLRRYLGVTLA
jgi:hypothetical protein